MREIDSRAVMAVLGYGCLLALGALTLWNELSFLSAMLTETSPLFYSTVYLGFSLSFLLIVFGYLVTPSYISRIVFGSAVVFLVAGFLLSDYSLGHALSLPEAVLSIGALCIGLGSGCGMTCWVIVFSSFSFKKACGVIIAGSVFATLPTFFIFSIVINNPSSFIPLVFAVLLFSIVFLILGIREELISPPLEKNSPSRTLNHKKIALGKILKRPLIETDSIKACQTILNGFGISIPCIIIISLFHFLLDSAGLSHSMSMLLKTTVSQGGNIVGALAIFLIWKLGNWETDVSKVFTWITPIFVATSLFFPFVDEQYWAVFSFLSTGFFTLVSITVMVSCLQFTKSRNISITAVYSLLACFLYIPGFIGNILGSLVLYAGVSSRLTIFASILIIATCCVLLALKIWRKIVPSKKGENPPGQTAQSPEMVFDLLKVICTEITLSYDLSKREAEILDFLVHGRDVPFIAEALNLSPHTIRGYIKTLYQTLGVHSRRELLDFVEQWNS